MPSLTTNIMRLRTILFALACLAVALVAFIVVVRFPAAQTAFARLCDLLPWLLLIVAGKSSVEHLANGGGIKGALNALLSDAKPGQGGAQ